ncbi:MAG: S8 family serine peptidase [Saccharofermentanales bacterium]
MRKATFFSRFVLLGALILTGAILVTGCLMPKRTVEDPIGQIYFEKTDPENLVFDQEAGVLYSNNELLVVAKEGVTYKKVQDLADQYQARIVGYIEISNDYQWRLSGTLSKQELDRLINELMDNPLLIHASLNQSIEMEVEDLSSEELEWLKPDASNPYPEGTSWGVDAILARDAWMLQGKMTPIRVGLIDNAFDSAGSVNNDQTGYKEEDMLYLGHEDLDFTQTFFNPPASARDNQTLFHGTHVAGIFAARFKNALGIDGIYPFGEGNLYGVSTKGLEVYDENVASNLSVLSSAGHKCALAELIARQVKVINISLNSNRVAGFAADRGDLSAINYIQSNADILGDFLNRLLDKGYDFVIVTAAGNNSNIPYSRMSDHDKYPFGWMRDDNFGKSQACTARYNLFYNAIRHAPVRDRIIVVGSAKIVYKGTEDYSFQKSEFSNAGDRLDIMAPGESIYSCMPGNDYESHQGTSMAAPHVTGAAAMVWSINPSLTGSQVKNILISTAGTKVAGSERNLLNARAAVERAFRSQEGQPDKKPGLDDPKEGVLISTLVDAADEHIRISGATVEALQNGRLIAAVSTDSDGRFELNLPEGQYQLKVSIDGYRSVEINDLSVSLQQVNYLEWIRLVREVSDVWEGLLGTYQGSYDAPQGETGLTLTIFMEGDKCRARFNFYNLPGKSNARSGSYLMDVSFDQASGQYTFTGVEWLHKPINYSFAHLSGRLEGSSLVGTSPVAFKVSRVNVQADPLSALEGTYKGSYYATQGETGLTLTVYMEGDRCRALFDFYNLPGRTNAKSGNYTMDVAYDEVRMEYSFKGVEWHVKPTTYSFVDLAGTYDGRIISGTNPTRFHLTRVDG